MTVSAGLLRRLAALCLSWGCGAAAAPWHAVDTPRFTLVGNAPGAYLAGLAAALQDFDRALDREAALGRHPAALELTVYVLEDARRLGLRKRCRACPGFYKATPEGAFIVVDLAALPPGRPVTRYLFHEYVHHRLRNRVPAAPLGVPRLPAWVEEGLAERYAAFHEDGPVAFLAPPPAHPDAQALRRPAVLRRLLAARAAPERGRRAAAFYLRSWVLVHYFHGSPRRRAQLAALLDAWDEGLDAEAALVRATGLDSAGFAAQRLAPYLDLLERSRDQPRFLVHHLPAAPARPTATPGSTRALDRRDAALYLSRLHLALGAPAAAAEALAPWLAPAAPRAVLHQGARLALAAGRFGRARFWANRALERDGTDPLALRLHADSLLLEALRQGRGAAAAARAAAQYRRALARRPADLAAHLGLALAAQIAVQAGGPCDEAALQGLEAIYPVYAGLATDTLLGRLHAACGRPEAAARHLRRALAQAPAAALRGELQRLLARLANET